jgi:hypothetical protein
MAFFAELYTVRWVLVSAVVLIYAASKYRAYQRLAAFKGPFSTGWCEVWHSYHILGKRSHLAYAAVNEKYGELLLFDIKRSKPQLIQCQ